MCVGAQSVSRRAFTIEKSLTNKRKGDTMSMIRVLGGILLIAGVVLIIVGIVESRSLADNLSTFFRGRLTQHTAYYIFGGIASAVVGLVLVTGVVGRSRS
jgi:hypothetical protein